MIGRRGGYCVKLAKRRRDLRRSGARGQGKLVLYQRIVAELQMTQCAIDRFLCVIVQRRSLNKLHADQRERHQGDQQEAAQVSLTVQHECR